jgi:hypothetical protein
MPAHFLAFAGALDLTQIDLLGFSRGYGCAQKVALDRSWFARKMLWSAPRPQAVRTSCTLRTGAQENT